MLFVRASSAAPNFLKQRRKRAAGGSLLFGYFFLATQEKVTRESRESDGFDLNSKWIPASSGMTDEGNARQGLNVTGFRVKQGVTRIRCPASQYLCGSQSAYF